jgi:hypothetical protein
MCLVHIVFIIFCFFLSFFFLLISLTGFYFYFYVTVFSDFEQYPHGTLYGLWSLFLCNSGSTGQSQPLNVGGIGHITPRIIREGYSIRHIRSKFLFSTYYDR